MTPSVWSPDWLCDRCDEGTGEAPGAIRDELDASVDRALGSASASMRFAELVTAQTPEPAAPWAAVVLTDGLAVSSYSVDWDEVLAIADTEAVFAVSTGPSL